MKEDIPANEAHRDLGDRLARTRLVRSIVAGVLLTLLSLVIVGVNLSSSSGIRINDDVNRYFDTCVGEGLASTTPRLSVSERGFPLSYVTTVRVPVCDNRVELKRVSKTYVEWGALGADVLFWTCASFAVMRMYTRRKHRKAESVPVV